VVIQSITDQVEYVQPSHTKSTGALIGFIPQLIMIINQAPEPALIYSSLSCIDQITERFGKRKPTIVLQAAETLAGENGLHSNDPKVQYMSTLTLASMAEILKEDMVPLIPKLLARVCALLRDTIATEKPNINLVNAGFELFNALLVQLPYIWTSKQLDDALRLAFQSTTNGLSDSSGSRKQFYQELSAQLELETVVLCLLRNYQWTRDEAGAKVSSRSNLSLRL
jgi:U3 small nucleolar RNA-associated protein 10